MYYADGEAWVVGATFGGPRVGIVNFERKPCPYQVTPQSWRHSVNGKLERDPGIVLKCVDPMATESQEVDAESVKDTFQFENNFKSFMTTVHATMLRRLDQPDFLIDLNGIKVDL